MVSLCCLLRRYPPYVALIFYTTEREGGKQGRKGEVTNDLLVLQLILLLFYLRDEKTKYEKTNEESRASPTACTMVMMIPKKDRAHPLQPPLRSLLLMMS